MDSKDQEWEGFESYNQSIDFAKLKECHTKIEPLLSPQIQKNQEKPIFDKKISIRLKSKRKNSILYAEHQKLHSINNLSQDSTPKPTIQATISIQKQKKTEKTIQCKAKGIPIYKQINFNSNGVIIYKGLKPITSTEYFNLDKQMPLCGITDDLSFNSKFQSGNLDLVTKLDNQYHLYISPDTNTRGHRQWFYFHVISSKAKQVKFVVHSFKKKLSLFQLGMRPYGKKIDEGIDRWQPIGFNIKYSRQQSKTLERKLKMLLKRQQYTLCFNLMLEQNVEMSIASSIPYTYTYLQSVISNLAFPTLKIVEFKETILCKTLTGLNVPLITINGSAQNNKNPKYIIINARTHPGQTSSSWVVDGVLKQLVNSIILQKIIFEFNIVVKIVPMLNAQGVYIGNYRTGVLGVDFNRLFLTGKHDLFPQVYALKQLVQKCKKKGFIDLYMDLHGHSILPGCFIYGPDPNFAPKTSLKTLTKDLGKSKYFMNKHCIMGVDSNKAETSRIYFQVQEGIYSLTCQNSLGLFYQNGSKQKEKQFLSIDWQCFGKDLIDIIINIYDEQNYGDRDFRMSMMSFGSQSFRESHHQLDFEWERSKTDEGISKVQQQILNLDIEDIQLPEIPELSGLPDIQSLNDSDNQSENLPQNKQQQLFSLVRSQILNKKTQVNPSSKIQDQGQQKGDFKTKSNSSKGKFISNFKQYRFGTEDPTLNQWYNRKRLLSIPKHLKTEKQTQSYLIRKSGPRSIPHQQLIFQSIEISKRIKTQQRHKQYPRRTISTKFYAENTISPLIQRQKALLENLISRNNC